jgi:dTDP-4-dehydrorhamnose 3,5-epimerase-like enzyme
MANRQALAFGSVRPDRGSVARYPIRSLRQAEKQREVPAGDLSFLGATLVKLPQHADSRGCLIALDRDQSLPFEVRRVYCIYQGPGKTVRGEHATSAHCAMVALQGAAEVDLDNGETHASVRLSATDQALCIHAGVWLRVRDFADDAILLVAASQVYAESQYFDRPNPTLLKAIAQTRWR